jgi:hypothetical protein
VARASIPRYRRRVVVWEPFALAIFFGLLISAAIYLIVMWPSIEPDDEAEPVGAPAKPEVSSKE